MVQLPKQWMAMKDDAGMSLVPLCNICGGAILETEGHVAVENTWEIIYTHLSCHQNRPKPKEFTAPLGGTDG